MTDTKPFKIPKELMERAWIVVRSNAGSEGVDGVTLKMYESCLEQNLYKLWNRMSSGSYFPKAVRSVSIPKKEGGLRILGIPSIEDRVAQTVVKLIFEPKVEAIFHPDSYGYRPNKSALDAIAITRQRCWGLDWVVEYDIKGLFDNIDHKLLMQAVEKHVSEKWITLYVERWLKSPIQGTDGRLIERNKGTPQGGVISPILANLFLHYVLDAWLSKHHSKIIWCRYSDDGLVHCRTEQEARYMLSVINQRFVQCGLSLHSDKTKIIYCKDSRRQGKYPNKTFSFLGYCFRSRRVRSKYKGYNFSGFNPAISKASIKSLMGEIRRWRLTRRSGSELSSIAQEINPIIKGWINYYGRYYITEMDRVFYHINNMLVKWAMRKYKSLSRRKAKARLFIAKVANEQPKLFVHWERGITGWFA